MARERPERGREHVGPKRVLRAEVDRAVQLDHGEPSRPCRQKVDSDQIRSDRASRGLGQLGRRRRRADRHPRSAEREVRPPFAGCGDPLDRSDDATGRDDQAEVVAERWDQLLRQRPVRAEPGSGLELRQPPLELGRIVAEHDVAAPTPETRLEHERQAESRRGAGTDHLRFRMRKPCSLERSGGEQLVVRGQEHTRRIEDLDAVLLQMGKGGEPVLDPVERLADVQPGQGHIAGLQQTDRLGRRHETDIEPFDATCREVRVRLAGMVRHDRELHVRRIVRPFAFSMGNRPVNGWLEDGAG